MLSAITYLPFNEKAKTIAKRNGLEICSVTWEDTARSKESCLGPNITDMTIECNNSRMPTFRQGSNYKDLTFDMPMDKVSLLVGNTKGEPLVPIKLYDLLQDVRPVLGPIDYSEDNVVRQSEFATTIKCDGCGVFPIGNVRYNCLECPESYDLCENCEHEKKETMSHSVFHSMKKTVAPPPAKTLKEGEPINLYCKERDENVIMCCQSSFLPIEEKQPGSEFAVAAFNYQNSVLAITCSAQGSSATLLNHYTKLYHNDNGQKKEFFGQRLVDNRRERGVQLTGEMTQEEKVQNVIVVIQIPLEQQPVQSRGIPKGLSNLGNDEYTFTMNNLAQLDDFDDDDDNLEYILELSELKSTEWKSTILEEHSVKFNRSPEKKMKKDVDHVIVKLGESKGKVAPISAQRIVRDKRFPIRVTLQFYKATSNGSFDNDTCKEINSQFEKAKTGSVAFGSLVVDRDAQKRTTSINHPVNTKTSFFSNFF